MIRAFIVRRWTRVFGFTVPGLPFPGLPFPGLAPDGAIALSCTAAGHFHTAGLNFDAIQGSVN